MLKQDHSVLMIGWEYPPHNSGGLGVACEGLTESLAGTNTQIYFTLPYRHPSALGHMKTVPCFDASWEQDGQPAPPFLAYSSVKTARKLAKQLNADELYALPQSELEQKVTRYAQLVHQEARKLRHDFEIIHAHDWMSFPAAVKVKKATHKPLVAHIHSTEYDRIPHGSGSPYILNTEQYGLHHADKIIAVSYYTKHLLVQRYQIDPAKIEVVHNGAPAMLKPSNPTRTSFAVHRPVVVFMGRLTMQKGAEYFLQVARQVTRQLPEALFVIAGDGDMYHELLFKAAYDQLSASLLFSGFVRDTQREKLLDRADVFVMPSLSEPFGLVAIEAAQRHTPVIVSKNTGVSEVLSSALAIDFWDIDVMSKAIVELLSRPELAQQTVTNQLRELSSVTWQSAAEKVKRVYQQAFLGR
jgi:glycosyltransferase involved in cell wall biosynthesis